MFVFPVRMPIKKKKKIDKHKKMLRNNGKQYDVYSPLQGF